MLEFLAFIPKQAHQTFWLWLKVNIHWIKIEFIKSIYSIEKFNIYDNADVVINP